MWLGSKLTSLSDSLFKYLFKLLFRYDIFISYARRDGKEYALKLRDQLKQLDFTCFLDQEEVPPGNSLNDTLKQALKKSAFLVIVGTDRAVKSRWVELEIGEFVKTGRAIIPIDIEGTLSDVPWRIVKEQDIVWIDETKAALARGVPSPNVADGIDKAFKIPRRNTRVRAQILATILLFVVVVVFSIFMIRQQVNAATRASAEAAQQKIAAANQKTLADAASADANEQRKAAEEAIRKAVDAEGKANDALTKAAAAEKAAGEAAAEAKEQERKALANAERAKAEQAKAEERTRYIRAQQIGVQADLAVDRSADTEQSVLLSIESLKRGFTPEGYAAWVRGMELLPRPVETMLARNDKEVTALAYSPDGKLFASGNQDGTVRLFDTSSTGKPVELQPNLKNAVRSIVFVKDGAWVAAAGENELAMWDLKTAKRAASVNTYHGKSFAVSPDGRYVAIAGSDTGDPLRVVDTASGELVVEGVEGRRPTSVAFSPNGRFLAVGGDAGKTSIGFWDVTAFEKGIEANREPITSITDVADFNYVAFSPKGNYFAAEIPDGAAKIWKVSYDVERYPYDKVIPIELSELYPPGTWIRTRGQESWWSLSFSADESYISTTPNSNTAVIWDVKNGRERARIGHEKEVKAMVFSPDGQLLASASDGVKLWELKFGSETRRLLREDNSNLGAAALAVDPSGEWLVTGSEDGARVFRTSDWSPVTKVQTGSVFKLIFSPDGKWLVVQTENELKMIDTNKWGVLKVISHPSALSSVVFSPDSRRLAASNDTRLRLFEVGSWQESLIASAGDIRNLAFSPDSRLIAAQVLVETMLSPDLKGHKGEIHVWEIAGKMPVACMDDKGGRSTNLSTVIWEEAFCSQIKGAAREVRLSEISRWIEQFNGGSLDKSPDGRWSTEGGEGTVLIYNEGNTSRRVATLMRGSGVISDLTFTRDSRWLVIATDERVAVWPLKPCDMIEAAYARLRRPALNDEERRTYISDKEPLQICPEEKRIEQRRQRRGLISRGQRVSR